jgi:hypothetical protein
MTVGETLANLSMNRLWVVLFILWYVNNCREMDQASSEPLRDRTTIWRLTFITALCGLAAAL